MDLDETWQVGLRPEKTKPCMFPAKSRYIIIITNELIRVMLSQL